MIMRKKKGVSLLIAALLTICMCVPVFAADIDSAGNIFEAGNLVSLPSNPFFGAVAAGQSVSAKNAKADGSVFAAGQDVTVQNSEIGESVYLAGNSISLKDSKVNGNIYCAGNSILITGDSEGNGVYATGNLISFEGTTNGFFVSGSEVVLAGTVNGDAVITADKVEIKDSAVVTGELKVTSPAEPEMSSGAKVGDYQFEKAETDKEDAAKAVAAAGIGAMILAKLLKGLYWIVAMAAFGMLLTWLFDRHLDGAVTMVKKNPGIMIATGAIAWAGIPVAALLLAITYILFPIAGMLTLAYILLLCAGLAFAGASLSRLVFPRMNRFASAAIGIAVLEILRLIPILGFIIGVAADIYLLGYVIQSLWLGRMKKETAEEGTVEAEKSNEEV